MSCFTPISQIIWPFVHISKYRELKEYAKELEVRVSKLDDNDTKTLFPTLWDHLTQTTWDDGTPRETSSLLLFVQDGMLKAMLRDREAGQCLWTAGVSVATVMFQLDTALSDPNAEWKADKAPGGAPPRNGKKK